MTAIFTNYSKEYILSLLTYVSYINMNGVMINNVQWDDYINKDLTDINNALNFRDNYKKYLSNKFDPVIAQKEYDTMLSSIDFFMNNFKIIKQDTIGFNGFSATTYELINDLPLYDYTAGEIFVAFRGTETTENWDLWTDLKLVFTDDFAYLQKDLFDFESQQTYALAYTQDAIASHQKVYLTGHSLGGHLTAVTLLKLKDLHDAAYVKDVIKKASVFNPAGISIFGGGFNGSGIDDIISNYYSCRGVNLVTSNIFEPTRNAMIITVFNHLGKRYPTVTENAGGGDTHDMSLLVKAFGVYSVLETLITEYPTSLTDLDGVPLLGNNARTYALERLLLHSTFKEKDEGIAINALAYNIINSFGITFNNNLYSSYVARFISLKEYFTNNSGFKLKITDLFNNLTHENNNQNRSAVYSLINNLSYVLIAPETHQTGIFEKVVLTKNKDTLNPENYSDLYFQSRIRFNRVFLEMIERKIILNIADSYSVIDPSTTSQFIYIENLNPSKRLNSFDKNLLMYVNTTPALEAPNQRSRFIQFAKESDTVVNVIKNNTVIFDSVGSNYINVLSDNNIIQSMNGDDYLVFKKETEYNTIMLHPMSDNVTVFNNSESLTSLNIDFSELPVSTFKFKCVNISANFTETKVFIQYGDTVINVSGIANLVAGDTILSFENIFTILICFSELFTTSEYFSLELDNNFIDHFIQATLPRYGEIDLTNGINKDYSKITKEHVEFIIERLNMCEGVVDATTISNLISYVKNKEHITSFTFTLNPLVIPVMNDVNSLVNHSLTKTALTQSLENFSGDRYNNIASIDINEHTIVTKNELSSVYYKKETKIYRDVAPLGGQPQWVWNGEYEYNREVNGVQVTAFYGAIQGNIINYYRNSIGVNVLDYSTEIAGNNISVKGTDGSDILIGENVFGQSDNYGLSGTTKINEIFERQNGNDILIGKSVTAYSGNNLLIGNSLTPFTENNPSLSVYRTKLKGGKGNDTFISLYDTDLQIIDWNLTPDDNTYANHVYLFNGGVVYSSNAKNTVISAPVEDDSSNTLNIFYATGNDTFIGNNGGLFIANKAAFDLNYFSQANDVFAVDFYNKYSNNNGTNKVYSGTKGLEGVLGVGDYADLSLGFNFFYGMGYNTVILGDDSTFISGGNSSVKLNGSRSNYYINTDDTFNFEGSSSNNTLFTVGYYQGTDIYSYAETYTLKGLHNTLVLGKSIYKVTLNGVSSSVVLGKNNTNESTINVNEIGVSTISVENNKSVNSLIINANNDILLDTRGTLTQGILSNLTVVTDSITTIDRLSIGEMTLNTSKDIILSNSKFTNVLLTSAGDYIEHLINSVDIQTLTGNFTPDTLLTYGSSESSNSIHHASIINAISTGQIDNSESFTHKGTLNDFILIGSNNGSNVSVDGSIENATFVKLNNFSYERSIDLEKTSEIIIKNSTLNHLDTFKNMRKTSLLINDSVIDNFTIDSMNNSTISIYDTEFKSLKLPSRALFNSTATIHGHSTGLTNLLIGGIDFSSNAVGSFMISKNNDYNGLIINNTNNLSIDGHQKNTFIDLILNNIAGNLNISNLVQSTINISSADKVYINDVSLKGTMNKINLSNEVYLNKVSGTPLVVADVSSLFIDLDTVGQVVMLNVNHVKFNSNTSVKVTLAKIDEYSIDKNYTNNYTLTVSGQVYDKSAINALRAQFLNSTEAYAIISATGIELFNIPTELPEPTVPYIDADGIYQGTNNNDVYTLSGTVAYKLHGKKGDDIYNFTNYNNYNRQIINYSIGDGHDTVNSVSMISLVINLIDIQSSDLKFTAIKDAINRIITLHIVHQNNVIFTINNYSNTTLEISTIDKTFFNIDINKYISSLFGTAGNDILTTINNDENYIYPMAGNDIINIVGGYKNEIYYSFGQGHDTINSANKPYTLIFDETINKQLVGYEIYNTTGFNIKHDGIVIVTINEPANCSLKFSNNNEYIYGTDIFSDLTAIIGTDFDDIINVDTASFVRAKGGNDLINVNVIGATIYAGSGTNTININYTDTSETSKVIYEQGDGLTNIKLLTTDFNKVTVNFKQLSGIKFEYDKNNHDMLNIYHKPVANGAFVKFLSIENYRKVIWDTFTDGRATILSTYGVNTTMYSHQTINTEAEKNYKLLNQ